MSFRMITAEGRKAECLIRRKALLEANMRIPADVRALGLAELESGKIPTSPFKPGFDITQHIRIVNSGKQVAAEFTSTGGFAAAWWERQRYEVDAGRDLVPVLYDAIYNVITDSTLPRMVSINSLGPAGVVFELTPEGGEVKFASIGSGSKAVEIQHYSVGLEYTEDVFIYNELFRLPNFERRFGEAHNALLNHIHLYPILSYAYAAANQTDGTALTYGANENLPERYLRTFEAAMANAVQDTTNPRRGPYALMVSTANLFTAERALTRVAQQGITAQSSALGRISTVIAYDGWTGTRGNKQTSYSGVTPGKAYLIDLSNRDMDYQSYFKHGLRRVVGESDMSRFILEQIIWDSRFGVYANPLASVEEITLPTLPEEA